MGTGELNARGNPEMDWHPINGEVENHLVASCYGNRNKLRPDELLGSYADFTFTLPLIVPLFQNESSYKTFEMKMSLLYM